MATNPVNLVDAVSTVSTRYARNRSLVMRMGKVVGTGGAGCVVRVGGSNVTSRALSTYSPVVNDVVVLLNDRDSWLILGRVT